MDNSTVQLENEGPLNSPGFMAYSLLLAVVTIVASVVIGFTILALFMATSIPRPVRIFLINLLFAGLVVAVALMFVIVSATVLVNSSSNDPRPRYLCRVYLWAFGSGVVARLWNLAAFSLSILAIVRFGKKTISMWCAAVVILVLWLAPMVITLHTLLPYIYEAQFVHGVACFPDNNRTIIVQARYTFLATWAIFGGLTPLTVSIIVPIVCLCYVARNIVTEGTQYRKGMAKFALFLVVGGSINFAGQIIPGLVALNAAAPGVYLSYGCAVISLLPTPIIIMVFLKPVREEVKKILTCGQLSTRAKELKSGTGTSCDATGSVSLEKV